MRHAQKLGNCDPAEMGAGKVFGGGLCPSMALPLQFGLSKLFATAPICNPTYLHSYTLPTSTYNAGGAIAL